MSMVEELKAVLRLSESATSGPWAACDRGSYGEENEGSVWNESMHDIDAVSTVRPLSSQATIRGDTTYRDAVFIAAVANLIRDHGQALVEALADAERYRWIREHSYVEFTCDSPRNVYMTNEQFDSSVDLARTKAGLGGVE